MPRSDFASRLPHAVDRDAVMPDLEALVRDAVATIEASDPAPDAILGRFVRLTSLTRSVSFHEGKLLEAGLIRLAEANRDLLVLSQGLRLPLTKAAIEAVANNAVENLRSLTLDAEAVTRSSYTPDLIIVDRARHAAQILDMKRSIVSYADTSRLEDLKARMMAAALILPDWLYREHKRTYVNDVAIGIVDGASSRSDHANGIWALDDIDALIEVEGAADAMAAMRRSFGSKVRRLLEAEARAATAEARQRAIGMSSDPRIRAQWARAFDNHEECLAARPDGTRRFRGRGPGDGGAVHDGAEGADPDENEPIPRQPVRFGFLRSARPH